MKLSVKSKYALYSMIYLEKNKKKGNITSLEIANSFNISIIYLEQVLVTLKKNNLITSTKGPQGGYRIRKKAKDITILEILVLFENNLIDFHVTNKTEIDVVINKIITDQLNSIIKTSLTNITLKQLIDELDYITDNKNFMYYI